MKNFKKLLTLLLVGVVLMLIIGCATTPSTSDETIQDFVKIVVDKDYMDIDGAKLIDYMQALKEDGSLDYAEDSGMITSINGKANTADYSVCWMLYTDDAELSNTAWGTVEIDGKIYASAISGANDMAIKDGATYVWVYKAF